MPESRNCLKCGTAFTPGLGNITSYTCPECQRHKEEMKHRKEALGFQRDQARSSERQARWAAEEARTTAAVAAAAQRAREKEAAESERENRALEAQAGVRKEQKRLKAEQKRLKDEQIRLKGEEWKHRACPMCGERIKKVAKLCFHCKSELSDHQQVQERVHQVEAAVRLVWNPDQPSYEFHPAAVYDQWPAIEEEGLKLGLEAQFVLLRRFLLVQIVTIEAALDQNLPADPLKPIEELVTKAGFPSVGKGLRHLNLEEKFRACATKFKAQQQKEEADRRRKDKRTEEARQARVHASQKKAEAEQLERFEKNKDLWSSQLSLFEELRSVLPRLLADLDESSEFSQMRLPLVLPKVIWIVLGVLGISMADDLDRLPPGLLIVVFLGYASVGVYVLFLPKQSTPFFEYKSLIWRLNTMGLIRLEEDPCYLTGLDLGRFIRTLKPRMYVLELASLKHKQHVRWLRSALIHLDRPDASIIATSIAVLERAISGDYGAGELLTTAANWNSLVTTQRDRELAESQRAERLEKELGFIARLAADRQEQD